MDGEIKIDAENTDEKSSETADESKNKSLLKRLFSLKMIIIYCIMILLLAGGLFAGWFFFLKGHDKNALVKNNQTEKKAQIDKNAAKKKKKPEFKDIVKLAPFVKIKLRPSGRFSYLTVNIALKLSNDSMRNSIEAEKAIIRSVVIREAGKMTWFVLRNPAGKLDLKYRLIASINSVLEKSSKARIENLYFTHFIMQ